LPEPPDPPDPPSIFAQTFIPDPPSTSSLFPPSSSLDLDLCSTVSSYGVTPFVFLRFFTAVCSPFYQICTRSVSLRFFTALCSPWKLAYSQILGYPLVSSGYVSQAITFDVHAAPPTSTQRASPTRSMAQTRQRFVTSVRWCMSLFLVLPLIQNFVVVRFNAAVCSLFELNLAFCAVCFVSLSWWQFEKKLINTPRLMNLVLSGIWYPSSFLSELVIFPKFPPQWSGLDVQESSVLQGSSSRLMFFSAFDAVLVTSCVTLDTVFQESSQIVLIVRFALCYSYDFCCISIYPLTIVIWSVLASVVVFYVVFFMLVVIPLSEAPKI